MQRAGGAAMTDPITPPPELVVQWVAQAWHEGTPVQVAASDLHIAAQAAQWGADQELEACAEWLRGAAPAWERQLRAARRPKPQSLKEQAFRELGDIYNDEKIDDHAYDTIRRALEALPND